MKNHQILFEKIKILLENHFGDKVNLDIDDYKDGYIESHLTIKDTDIWISSDEYEFTIGSGFNHRHYNPEFDSLKECTDELFNLLTKRKKITEYYKGKSCFKIKIWILLLNAAFICWNLL